jgi:uncharacterized OB-fold protein
MEARSYLHDWREHGRLTLQRCGGCGVTVFYPRSRCPSCWADELEMLESSGTGTIVTETRVRRGLSPELSVEAPITIAEILLDEGVTMIARIIETGAYPNSAVVKLYSSAPRAPSPTFERAKPSQKPGEITT